MHICCMFPRRSFQDNDKQTYSYTAMYSSMTSVVFVSSKIKLYPYHAFEDFFGSTSSLPHFLPVAILLSKLNICDGRFNTKVLNTTSEISVSSNVQV